MGEVLQIAQACNKFMSLGDLHGYLTTRGCQKCSLGFQAGLNGCCVARGNPMSHRILLGEGPGEHEDATSLPFTGPAGKLLDKMFTSIGYDTNQDFYLTNVVLCRPIARGGFKRNFTPLIEQQKQCRQYLEEQLTLIRPKLVVPLGNVATKALLGQDTPGITTMHGTIHSLRIKGSEALVFPLLHPAALLHAKKNPQQELEYKTIMWGDLQRLQQLITERNL